MSWGEALRLVRLLLNDPSSQFGAEMAGWRFPVDRSTLVLSDLYDFQTAVRWVDGGKKGPRPVPHPGRPMKVDDGSGIRRGNAAGRSRAEVVEILSRFGHVPV